MDVNKNFDIETTNEEEESSSFNFQTIYQAFILNWQWFLLSIIICLGASYLYLRYTTPTYQAFAKFLIKEGNNRGYRGTLSNMTEFGMISNSTGFENEIEILHSHSIATHAVRDLKIYVNYSMEGRIKDHILYKKQPITVDIDATSLEKLNSPINLTIMRNGTIYEVEGTYYVPINDNSNEDPFTIKRKFSSLPATLHTRAGIISLTANNGYTLNDGEIEKVSITSPRFCAYKYTGSLTITPASKTTTIAQMQLIDEIPQRAIDYLNQLVIVYNQQANEDKNAVALQTEKFINSRLEKISTELGATEGQLEDYKQRNNMIEFKLNAGQSLGNQNEAYKRLTEMETQIALLNSVAEFMNESGRNLQVLPSNVGLSDGSSTQLINKYNELVLERNRLLRSASENSPVVETITEEITELRTNIRRAINQTRKNLDIQRDAIYSEFAKYNTKIAETPEQERILTQIGRQQEVKSGLYLMLLQKREENSISLAATADKGKMIDEPQFGGQVSPKSSMIMLIGLLVGFAIPALLVFLIRFLRYRIEGHDDVARLTKLPIIGDVAIASDKVKSKANIVVQENKNNHIEEIFRSIRTNLQFTLSEGQKTIMFTSGESGEGKTFNCANLAVSFALLNKKVLIVGLDIRKPRLAELFEVKDHHHGITPLLVKNNPTYEEIKTQIVPSGINDNLELLMAGPIPPNPTELLSHKSLDIIFNHLREHYDYILIDTAPIGLVTDTFQIGRIADTTIYICRADYTPKASLAIINNIAKEKKLPKVSIVINGIDMSKKKYGYMYGYGKYGKYSKYGRSGYYSNYGGYGNYANSHYGNKNDDSLKR